MSHLRFHHVRQLEKKAGIHRASPTSGERARYVPSPEVPQDGEDGDLGTVVQGTVQYPLGR